MQIPILSGVFTDAVGDIRASYPVNLEPMLIKSGISEGYLRAAAGVSAFGTGPGADRGGINWNGVCYRVMGSSLVSVAEDGSVIVLGNVGFGGPVSMDYSFDLLAIASGGNLFYFDGATVTQNTDPDLGVVIDVLWVDGYFMTTDGTSLVVTELNDPYSVNPLKYGSSEVDPDPVTGLIKIQDEIYALNRNTIENFRNIGGNGFPFQRNTTAMIQKGCVGTFAKTPFLQTFAFIGSGRNEAISVYLAGGGQAIPISTTEIDTELAALTAEEQAAIEIETRKDQDEERLYIHLPTKTLVYYAQASKENGSPVWSVLASGVGADGSYTARHLTLAYGKWLCGNPDGDIGFLDYSVETQFGAVAGWRFDTVFAYNESRGAIFKSVELVGLSGLALLGVNPTMFFSYTLDGTTWSNERAISMGQRGNRAERMQWRPMFRMGNYASLRFRGANTAIASFARLEADVEALAV